MSFIGATGYNENQEELDTLQDEIDANASYINNLVGIPDPLHTAIFGINLLNPGLFGLVERAEVNIKALQTGLEGEGTTISGIETTISGIETEVAGIQTEITGIQGEITGVQGEISSIQFIQLPALTGVVSTIGGIAGDAEIKANRALGIWDYSGDNVYHKKTGNVGIGTTFGSVLTNKLEIGGNLNISAGSKYKINNVDLAFSDLGGTLSYNSLSDKPTLFDGNYNSLSNKLTGGTNINIIGNAINNTYTLPTAGVGAGGTLGGVRVDNSTIFINGSGVISSAAGTPQVNSDWTQTNTSLKSFIQNKPTAGTNISLANNTITNIITGSPTQNIITLNDNYLIVKDKPDSQIVSQVDVPLTSGNEPVSNPSVVPTTEGNPITHKTLNFAYVAPPLRYDFTNYNSEATWKAYVATIPNFTYSLDALFYGAYQDAVFTGGPTIGWVQMTLPSTHNFFTIKYGLGDFDATGDVRLLVNGVVKSTATNTNRSITYSQRYNAGDVVRIEETLSTMSANFIFQFINVPPALTYDFTNDNTEASWKAKAATIPNFTYSLDSFLTSFDPDAVWTADSVVGWVQMTLPSTHNFLTITYGLGTRGEQEVRLLINGVVKSTATNTNRSITYSQAYNAGDVVRIEETLSTMSANFIFQFTNVPPTLTYDFTNYNTSSTWVAYAATIPTFTYSLNYILDPFDPDAVFTATSTIGWVQMTLPSGYNFFTITYGLGTQAGSGEVRLLINGVVKSTYNINNSVITYSQRYNAGDVVRIEETYSTMSANFIFQFTNTNPNTYTLSVQEGTSIQVNNGTAQYLSGNYTISVGATQSSVVKSGIGQVGDDPYPLTNGSTIAIRYSMLQRITSTINIKKDGLIKYVPASGTNPTTGTWNIIDLDTQPLTQFAGNLPASRLDNIDMSKVATGNLDWSRIASQPALSSLAGNLPLNRTDGNLPASRLDNIDMSKVATGNLHHSRVQDFYIGINDRFHRIVYAWDNVVDTQGIWTNKFKINTNLHLNQYNHAYNYYQYFLSMSPNNVQDRHKYWFGTVKMSIIVGTDNTANTQWFLLRGDNNNFDIRGTSSTSGVWWLDIWTYTAAYCESLIAILH